MSHLESIRAAIKEPQSVWMQFTTAYRTDRLDMYIFVEGIDDVAYFRPLAQACLKSGLARIFICWNKDGVLGALNSIRTKSAHARRCAFIVDRDFDDLVGKHEPDDEALLVTEFYSVENHLCCSAATDAVWTDIWGLPEVDGRLEAIRSYCDEAGATLFTAALPIMAWILWHCRRMLPLNLDNVALHKLFVVEADGRTRRKPEALQHLKKAACSPGQPRPPISELLAEARILRALPGKRRTRGKYEVFVLVQALKNVLMQLDRPKGVRGGRPSPVVELAHTKFVRLVAAKVPYPSEWAEFFERIAAQ